MKNQIWRTARPFGRGAAGAALMPSAALAVTPPAACSIDTRDQNHGGTAGGYAWIGPNYILGTINAPGLPAGGEGVYIGGIVLSGQESGAGALPGVQSIPVFCIDIPDDLQQGVFTSVSLAAITSPGNTAQVGYSPAQLDNLLKFMVYANGQGTNTPQSSAAEQLGIWEIISEPNAPWDVTSGNFSAAPWDANNNSVLTLANNWLGHTTATSTTGYSLGLLEPQSGNQVQAYLKFAPAADSTTIGAVPEPATWATMIVGFGAVGSTMRRRRATAARA